MSTKEYHRKYYRMNKHKWSESKNRLSFPCVYFFINNYSELIRIGSTGNLSARMSYYFTHYYDSEVLKVHGLDKVKYIKLDSIQKARKLEAIFIRAFDKPILNDNNGDLKGWQDVLEEEEILEYAKKMEEFDITRYKNILNKEMILFI